MVKTSLTKPKNAAVMSESLFVTRLYRGRIAVAQGLEKTCLAIAA